MTVCSAHRERAVILIVRLRTNERIRVRDGGWGRLRRPESRGGHGDERGCRSARAMAGWGRDRIMQEINALGVPCGSGSCSEVYLEKAFDNTDFRPAERLPIARELGETSLMFMVHPTLSDDDIQTTCEAVRKVVTTALK